MREFLPVFLCLPVVNGVAHPLEINFPVPWDADAATTASHVSLLHFSPTVEPTVVVSVDDTAAIVCEEN